MAKLIKRDGTGEDTQVTDLPQAASGRRGMVIDKDTFEAKSEAQQIRERAEAQAAQMIETARAEADRIMAQAHTEAESAKATAHEEGFARGQDEGARDLIEATLRVNQSTEEMEAKIVPQLKMLAMAIARRVIGRELEFHPEAIVEMVKQTLADKARQRREITLRVNPADVQILKESRAELLEMVSRTKDIVIREDSDVAPHGVIIETEAGIIDAQLETQLGAFERLLAAMP
jgi:type III secretion protein L